MHPLLWTRASPWATRSPPPLPAGGVLGAGALVAAGVGGAGVLVGAAAPPQAAARIIVAPAIPEMREVVRFKSPPLSSGCALLFSSWLLIGVKEYPTSANQHLAQILMGYALYL